MTFPELADSATNRREAADFEVPSPTSAGRSPSGSRTARLSLRVETLISIRFMAQRPSQSSAWCRPPGRQRNLQREKQARLPLQPRSATRGASLKAEPIIRLELLHELEKSWPHFRPSAVDFCGSRLAIGAATERARALAMPAGTRAKPYKRDSSGVAPA